MSSPADRSDPGAVFVPPGAVPAARRPIVAGIVAGIRRWVLAVACVVSLGFPAAFAPAGGGSGGIGTPVIYAVPPVIVLALLPSARPRAPRPG